MPLLRITDLEDQFLMVTTLEVVQRLFPGQVSDEEIIKATADQGSFTTALVTVGGDRWPVTIRRLPEEIPSLLKRQAG